MHDAHSWRHDLQAVKGAHPPLEEFVARPVACELDAHVELQRIRHPGKVDLHGVIDDEVDRHQRLDQAGGLARLAHRVAHRREVDHQRHAGEVLQQDSRDDEGDLLGPLRLRLPGGERADVLFADALAVEVAHQGFEHDAQADRKP